MSKIGKKLIVIPDGVQVSVADRIATIKGKKGELKVNLHPVVNVEVTDGGVQVGVSDPSQRKQRAMWGTFRALLANAINGVSEGFERKLEINGVGYKAEVKGKNLVLNVGYSHPVELGIPEGLEVSVEKNIITISGIDKELVGQFAALVRATRKPEPYKGKGIKYEDEVIRRKAGKVVKAVGA